MIPDIQQITNAMKASIQDWHKESNPSQNPFKEGEFLYLIYKKNQIDTIQWHVEDEIRRPDLPPSELVKFKREIDKLNQEKINKTETDIALSSYDSDYEDSNEQSFSFFDELKSNSKSLKKKRKYKKLNSSSKTSHKK